MIENLFINSTKTSFKAVLLHNYYRQFQLVTGFISKKLMKTLNSFWDVYTTIKIGGHSVGDLNSGHSFAWTYGGDTKYCCFLCQWDSRSQSWVT